MQTKKNIYKHRIILFALLVSVGCAEGRLIPEDNEVNQITDSIIGNEMIHASGTEILDGNNRAIKLKGVLLEGWLMWNGTLWAAGLTSETKIRKRLTTMTSEAFVDSFSVAVYENFIIEKDIELISAIGFNVVRVPFNHTVFEDENPYKDYTAIGWRCIDSLLNWCEKHEVYVVLDLHSAPGGQGTFVTDPDPVTLWASEENQNKTVELWSAIADRYKDRKIIAGYDLLNEPDPPRADQLVPLYEKIIAAIRQVDSTHMLILEGKTFASDFSMFKNRLDHNQVFSFHSYNFLSDKSDEKNLNKLKLIAQEQDVPLWNGEIGAHRISWVENEFKLFENPKYSVNGWIFWPWKRGYAESDRFRCLAQYKFTPEWEKIGLSLAALIDNSQSVDKDLAKKGMRDFLMSCRAENLIFDDEMKTMIQKYLKE